MGCLNYETFTSLFYLKNSLYKFKMKHIFFPTLEPISQVKTTKQNEKEKKSLQSFYPVEKIIKI